MKTRAQVRELLRSAERDSMRKDKLLQERVSAQWLQGLQLAMCSVWLSQVA